MRTFSYTIKHAVFLLSFFLTACGFHLQGKVALSPHLKTMHLETPDPYGHLANDLRQNLTLSDVVITNKEEAKVILRVMQDSESQALLSVSGTQQTRQNNLILTVTFDLETSSGQIISPPQTITQTRTITTQSNQILGSGNEATLYYQQMRLAAARAIMDRLASNDVTAQVNQVFSQHTNKRKTQ